MRIIGIKVVTFFNKFPTPNVNKLLTSAIILIKKIIWQKICMEYSITPLSIITPVFRHQTDNHSKPTWRVYEQAIVSKLQ